MESKVEVLGVWSISMEVQEQKFGELGVEALTARSKGWGSQEYKHGKFGVKFGRLGVEVQRVRSRSWWSQEQKHGKSGVEV